MDVLIESTGALSSAVRRAASLSRPQDAVAWARWTLTFDEELLSGGEARARAWRLLTRGALVPLAPDLENNVRRNFGARAAAAAKALHRLQVGALLADPTGLPSKLSSDLAQTGDFSSAEADWLALQAQQDLAKLLASLRKLYPCDEPQEGQAVFVSWTGQSKSGRAMAWVFDGAQEGAARLGLEVFSGGFVRDDAAFEALARRFFGTQALRPGQAEGIAALLSGKDLTLHMPTGGGKSLVFYLAALLSPGTALVVAPLRALLRDQHRRLADVGITRVGLLLGDDPESTRHGLEALEGGRLVLLLAAPERLDSRAFRRALRGAAEGEGISFVAIDEAQCAARRGPDWRPSYRALGARLREWASSPGVEPPLAALSGAASSGALAEAEKVLGLRSPQRVRVGGARANLSIHVWSGAAPDHVARLRELLTRTLPQGRFGPGIVFCPRVEGPLGAATISQELAWLEGIDAAAYTGRAPSGAEPERWSRDKRRAAEEFLAGRRGLLCATRAFGLGVDRADVRFTIHVGLPSSLEEFYQQAGRAGRDGLEANCWIILQNLCARRARRWAELPVEELRAELAGLEKGRRDDVSRAYGMHLAGFPGERVELHDVDVALWALGDFSKPERKTAAIEGADGEALTRALVRLESAGALRLESRFKDGWCVEAVEGWSHESARRAAAELIARDYRAVEPARRGSLAELVELALSTHRPIGSKP